MSLIFQHPPIFLGEKVTDDASLGQGFDDLPLALCLALLEGLMRNLDHFFPELFLLRSPIEIHLRPPDA